jgi:capsular polysaccharide biosynthesis protein
MAKKPTKAVPVKNPQERQWEVESAMNTIKRYNDIVKDRALMRDVKTEINKMQKLVTGGSVIKKK